ncbi:UNVERIFIED_CONTAM: hypothetical protein Slati_2200500 [Sesamum latifolium]|uniref:Uncharacterized protein n=1 Tax=Sesamum latifolium TaxID=2727402 RepID=A0AAW2WTA5_9LAMI
MTIRRRDKDDELWSNPKFLHQLINIRLPKTTGEPTSNPRVDTPGSLATLDPPYERGLSRLGRNLPPPRHLPPPFLRTHPRGYGPPGVGSTSGHQRKKTD